MNKEMIASLEFRAKQVAYHLGRPNGGRWGRWVWEQHPFDWRIIGPGKIQFFRKGHNRHEASIIFDNIRPKSITKQIIHPAELLSSRVDDANTTVLTNNSKKTNLTRTYSYEEGETVSVQQEAGVAIGLSLRQQFGYGGAASPVSGETEITASVDAHYSKSWGSENSTTIQISNEVEVPPKYEATVTISKSTSDFSQHCEYWCDVDHSVLVYSGNEVEYNWNSMKEMETSVSGFGIWKNGAQENKFITKPVTKNVLEILTKEVTTHLETNVKFSNASSGNVKITERKL